MKADFTVEQIIDQARAFQLRGNYSDALSILGELGGELDRYQKVDIQILRSISYTTLAQFRNAIRCLISALSFSIESKNEKGAVECFYYIAEILYLQNNFQEAQDLLKNLLKVYADSPQNNILARFNYLLGETIRILNSGNPEIIEKEALFLTRKGIRPLFR